MFHKGKFINIMKEARVSLVIKVRVVINDCRYFPRMLTR